MIGDEAVVNEEKEHIKDGREGRADGGDCSADNKNRDGDDDESGSQYSRGSDGGGGDGDDRCCSETRSGSGKEKEEEEDEEEGGELERHGSTATVKLERSEKMELWYIVNDMARPRRNQTRQLKPRRMWTAEENELLEQLVAKHGARNWYKFEKYFDGRKGTHLRSHYKHALENKNSKRPFSKEEDEYIVREHDRLGGKWSSIARKMDRRVDNDVKNRYRMLMRKKDADERRRGAGGGGAAAGSELLSCKRPPLTRD